jgi:hypothetical protein
MLEEIEWSVRVVENAFALENVRRACEVVVIEDEPWQEVENVVFLVVVVVNGYDVQRLIGGGHDVLHLSPQTSHEARCFRHYHWLALEYHAHPPRLRDLMLGSLDQYLGDMSYAWHSSLPPCKKRKLLQVGDPRQEFHIRNPYYQVGQVFQGGSLLGEDDGEIY